MAASAGKNMPKRIIEVGKIVKGWVLGSAVQSTDPEVLKSIKRNNISNNAYKELTDFGNTSKSNKTYTEVILGLPEDNKQKHFESLRFGIDSNVNRISMYQSMLLTGTEMSSQVHRKKFGLMTKFRTIPGCIGIYDIFGEKQPVAEIEEYPVLSPLQVYTVSVFAHPNLYRVKLKLPALSLYIPVGSIKLNNIGLPSPAIV